MEISFNNIILHRLYAWHKQNLPALHPDKRTERPEPFPLARVFAKRWKPTPAMFTGGCCLTEWNDACATVEVWAAVRAKFTKTEKTFKTCVILIYYDFFFFNWSRVIKRWGNFRKLFVFLTNTPPWLLKTLFVK